MQQAASKRTPPFAQALPLPGPVMIAAISFTCNAVRERTSQANAGPEYGTISTHVTYNTIRL